ncbi:MAG: helix-turn-helix domain-containing protein [Planctomycetes bacterium]|nr:helix-turn-helix domain-containing protein [Planctomycetota bacterium]
MRTLSELLVHPIRLRILGALSGREMTTRKLARVLREVPQATLYRHVRTLAENGLLEVSEQRTVNGIVESTYRLVPGAARLDREAFAALPPADHLRCFGMFAGAQLVEAQDYFTQPSYDTTREGMTYFRAGLMLDDAEAQEFRVELLALVKRFGSRPEAGRRMRMLSVAFIPETEDSTEP